jgi:hypothetical protein
MSSQEVGGGASLSTEPATGTSAATDVSLREHLASRLHDAEKRIDERDRYIREADLRFAEERDRRYAEVATEREKALKIKETADLAALSLAREIQDYKDEKANELRSQIERERGDYATQSDLKGAVEKLEQALIPLTQFVAARQGGADQSANLGRLIATVGVLLGIVVVVATYLSGH